jgi:hypothetical protein
MHAPTSGGCFARIIDRFGELPDHRRMARMTNSMVLGVALALVACGKKNDGDNKKESGDPPVAAKAAAPEPTQPAAPSGPWQLDAAAVQGKLQGTWVMKNAGYLGSSEAWEIKGDQVKIWDSKQNKETTGKLTIETPCSASVKVGSDQSGWETTSYTYGWDGDKLHFGLGQAGVKQGNKIVACTSGGVFVSDTSGCKQYKHEFDKWQASDGKCSVAGDTFKAAATSGDTYEHQLKVKGDTLLDDQFVVATPAQKVATYDEAKAQAK